MIGQDEGKREGIDGGECGGERDEALQISQCRIELTVKKNAAVLLEKGENCEQRWREEDEERSRTWKDANPQVYVSM